MFQHLQEKGWDQKWNITLSQMWFVGDWVVVGPAILCIKKTKLRLRSVAKRSEAYLNLFFFDTRIAEPHYSQVKNKNLENLENIET